MNRPDHVLERTVREAGDRLRAGLAARFRDLDLAEEALAYACQAAVETWGRNGAPRDPAAWLYAAARRRGIDLTRRARTRDAYRPDPPEPAPTPEEVVIAAFEPIPDERLRLIFACCHPALAGEARIALTLRVICGLSTERLARAFLVSETAMIQRLTRAKAKIRDARIPFEVPDPEAWPERIEAVLAALEIAYAQAYEDAAGKGEAAELAIETLRLSGVLAELLPAEPEVLGLAALIRMAEARRPARVGSDGTMIPLQDQDPSLWDRRLIDQAARQLASAAACGRTGPYQLLAAIHGAHLSRAETGVTPWADILQLYDGLMHLRPSPIAALNRAVAVEQVEGPAAALAALPEEGRLADYGPYYAVRAHLLAATGARAAGRAAYDRAITLAAGPAERAWLQQRRAALADAS